MAKPNKLEQQPIVEPITKIEPINKEIDTSEKVTPLHLKEGGYVEFENKLYKQDALKELRPELFALRLEDGRQSNSNFGTKFPNIATKGDIFVRVDTLPNRVFKFDGRRWIEQNKDVTQSYLENNYIEFLIGKIEKGEYDLDQMTDQEKVEIENFLKNQNT